MKNTPYNKILNRLKSSPLMISNPEELAQSILTKIEHLPASKKKNKIIHITGIFSGIAACFLCCLFIYEIFYSSAMQPVNVVRQTSSNKIIENDFLALEANNVPEGIKHYSTTKKIEIATSIMEEKQSNMKRRNKLYANYLNN